MANQRSILETGTAIYVVKLSICSGYKVWLLQCDVRTAKLAPSSLKMNLANFVTQIYFWFFSQTLTISFVIYTSQASKLLCLWNESFKRIKEITAKLLLKLEYEKGKKIKILKQHCEKRISLFIFNQKLREYSTIYINFYSFLAIIVLLAPNLLFSPNRSCPGFYRYVL